MSLIKKMGLKLQNLIKKPLIKLENLKDTPHSIAVGFAIGVATSFTPFVGFHLLIAICLTHMIHQNCIAATIGTIAGNPWTFPLIWYSTLHTGEILLGHGISTQSINFISLFKELFHAVIMLDFRTFISDIWPVLFPMMIGCIPFVIGIMLLLPKFIQRVLQQRQKRRNNNDCRNRL